MSKLPKPEYRKLNIFFIVDTSGSMKENSRIGAVNTAIEDSMTVIKKIQNLDQQIWVAVLSFATEAAWVTPAPVPVDNYEHTQLSAGGLTAFGDACVELEKKLDAFNESSRASYAPVFILISDGEPTDSWQAGLEKLKNNRWYKRGVKAAIDVDGDADKSVLMSFTGNSETVLDSNGPKELEKHIRFVTMAASMVSSHSDTVDPGNGGEIPPEVDPTGNLGTQISEYVNGEPVDTDPNPEPTRTSNPFSTDWKDTF